MSAGLGMLKREWEARWSGRFLGQAGPGSVDYLDGRVSSFVWYCDQFGCSLDEARKTLTQWLTPVDSAYLRSYQKAGVGLVDLFRSAALANAIPGAHRGDPGLFSAVYDIAPDGRVRTYRVALGEP
ncbi:MAG TPA: hypothetical protein VD948_08325 [Rhodothermales bacterium]|nr:hypothetical protein [Rhodothermales bacterium]